MQETMDNYYIRCKALKSYGLALEELNNYANFKDVFSKYEFEMVMKTKQNRKNKRYRTKKKLLNVYEIRNYFSNSKIVFGTCTLNNKELENEERTRTKKLDKWLKKHFIYSIVNKDYGSKTNREHYHFIGITTENLKNTGKKSKKGYELYVLEKNDYTLGHEPGICLLDINENILTDDKKLVNYLLKLNNHSNKEGTKSRVRIIKGEIYKNLENIFKIKILEH